MQKTHLESNFIEGPLNEPRKYYLMRLREC